MSKSIAVRALRPDEWEIFRAIRLKALKAHPGVFLHPYENAVMQGEAYWREMLKGGDKEVFGLFDGVELCGIASVFTWREDPSRETGVFAMDYIDEAHRGRGLMKLLYRARIDWALMQKQFRSLVISHRVGNEASRRAMVAAGFVFKDKNVITWPDGIQDEEWNYTLDLDRLRLGAC